ncbi:ABC transporter ATP-binding protein [Xanthobacter tagetidis]|jgi:putative spermidine/putrescine transport system ATP-binding protein|uniref:ABC transporter ATP-binding protein n=1 Tax=Xanthobacter tagetidis TaxID=60216 RepID=A0A3L7A4W5_9HYPH|nr:ABC transporter ATP-binding protein [Xanthobacter tagetidis]MBB6309990.1 putative spermidine/putrescine transport system ATP-binding protein [Xanthobacter tagetidis]RLP75095.1 ABC transporter ATP-binding protein [Xanthobacter tagetidis]
MGSRLSIAGLTKAFSGKTVLDDMSLAIGEGEFISLLGPSGCGKTTTLNLVAGFFAPDGGSIALDGRDITGLPTYQRGVSMVFQNYALFPHMSVAQNIGFGLRMRGENAAAIAARVEEMLALVQLPGVADRYPRQLSGGQQQRIGLARALAVHPGLMLLDEPMSNLDAKLRREMQLELREILAKVGTTTLYVTHDQEEALAMSDRVVVMNGGRVEQMGTPTDIYHAPRTRFVAGFVGESNFVPAEVLGIEGDQARVRIGPVHQARVMLRNARPDAGGRLTLLVRPEHIHIGAPGTDALPATIRAVAFGGPSVRLRAEAEGLPALDCEAASNWAGDLKSGDAVGLRIADDAWYVMPAEAGR